MTRVLCVRFTILRMLVGVAVVGLLLGQIASVLQSRSLSATRMAEMYARREAGLRQRISEGCWMIRCMPDDPAHLQKLADMYGHRKEAYLRVARDPWLRVSSGFE